MTYSIHFPLNSMWEKQPFKWACDTRDFIHIGIVEQVLPDIVAWHSIPERHINKVLDYMSKYLVKRGTMCELSVEHMVAPYICELRLICGVVLT